MKLSLMLPSAYFIINKLLGKNSAFFIRPLLVYCFDDLDDQDGVSVASYILKQNKQILVLHRLF